MDFIEDDWNDDDGRTSEEQLQEARDREIMQRDFEREIYKRCDEEDAAEADSFCQHEETRINLSTCTVQCVLCDEHLISMDFLVARELRVTQ